MSKTIILLSILLVSLNAYKFVTVEKKPLMDIPWPFEICGEGTWTIESLTLGAKPARSSNDNITITGTAGDDVTFTQVHLDVYLNGQFVHDDNFPFAKSFAAGDTVQFKMTNYIPPYTPPGSFTLKFTFKNGNNSNGCLSMQFKL